MITYVHLELRQIYCSLEIVLRGNSAVMITHDHYFGLTRIRRKFSSNSEYSKPRASGKDDRAKRLRSGKFSADYASRFPIRRYQQLTNQLATGGLFRPGNEEPNNLSPVIAERDHQHARRMRSPESITRARRRGRRGEAGRRLAPGPAWAVSRVLVFYWVNHQRSVAD